MPRQALSLAAAFELLKIAPFIEFGESLTDWWVVKCVPAPIRVLAEAEAVG